MLVTSVAPLRAYFYHEGLVRFASSAYNSSEANRGRESQVLTNTSVGRCSPVGHISTPLPLYFLFNISHSSLSLLLFDVLCYKRRAS